MCGISGKIYFGDHAVEREDLAKMTTALHHRGPDDTGWYLSKNSRVGLGHNRLAIIDPSPSGHQPMRYANRYVITFNGEMYNHAALRKQLQAEGYSFTSNTDTEVILALYDKYGHDCMEHLDGMFAFAIYDEKQEILFCARDRLGEKPFKYYCDGRVFMFASEIKALLTQPDCPRQVDYTAINHYLTLQYVPAPLTGWQNIYKLPAAHYLEVNLRSGAINQQRYWQPSLAQTTHHSTHNWAQQIGTALENAVAARLMSDVPLGAFLSGGLDSSLVVALMQRHSATPIKTFNIDFAEGAHSEAVWAKRVSEHVGTDHTTFRVTPDLREMVQKLARGLDEPFADSSYLPTYFVSQLARQKVTVALTGDGADELFAGYRHYLAHRAAAWVTQVPGGAATARGMPVSSPRWQRWQEGLRLPPGERHAHLIAYLTNHRKTQLYHPSFVAQHALGDTYTVLAEQWVSQKGVSAIAAAQYVDTLTYLPEDILMKTDAASMSVSLEARAPFLDHHLVELAYALPETLKVSALGQQKYILKYIARNVWPQLLPPGITERPKHGFTLPLAQWLKGDLHELLTDTLMSPTARARELFAPTAVERLVADLQKSDHVARPLWALLMLELWFQNYAD